MWTLTDIRFSLYLSRNVTYPDIYKHYKQPHSCNWEYLHWQLHAQNIKNTSFNIMHTVLYQYVELHRFCRMTTVLAVCPSLRVICVINVKKTYQFKTHCKDDRHSSKTANIILPGLMIKQRWTSWRLKWNDIQIHWTALGRMKQLISPKLNSLLFRLQT